MTLTVTVSQDEFYAGQYTDQSSAEELDAMFNTYLAQVTQALEADFPDASVTVTAAHPGQSGQVYAEGVEVGDVRESMNRVFDAGLWAA